MKRIQQCLLGIFLIGILLMLTMPAKASYSDEQALADAFLSSPREFVSTLSEQAYSQQIETLSVITSQWDTDSEKAAHKQALLESAEASDLTQAERRVVKWMLENSGLRQNYPLFGETVDYRELFSRVLEADGVYANVLASELEEVFLDDPAAFVKALAQEDAQIRSFADYGLLENLYYHYGTERIASLLQTVENEIGADELQRQTLQELRKIAADFAENDRPKPSEPSENTETAPTEATSPSVTQNAERRDWIVPAVMGVLVILIAVVVAVVQKFRYR